MRPRFFNVLLAVSVLAASLLGGMACGKVVPRPTDADGAPGDPLEESVTDGEPPVPLPEEPGTPPGEEAVPSPVASTPPGGIPSPPNGILGPGEADKILAANAQPRIDVQSHGAEPRAPVVFTAKAGAKETLRMRMGMELTAAGNQAAAQPPIEMTFALTTAAADARGESPIAGELRGIDVKPATPDQAKMAEAMRGPLSALEGLKFDYSLTKTGMHRDFKLQKSAKLGGPQAQIAMGIVQSYRSTATPFPEEPLGIGATWTVVSRHPDAGADLMQFSTCKIVERSGNQVTLEISTKQLAAAAEVAAFGLAPGVKPRLTSFDSGGTGRTVYDTTRAAVISSKSTVNTRMALEIVQQGAPVNTAVEQKVTIEFEGVDGKTAPKKK